VSERALPPPPRRILRRAIDARAEAALRATFEPVLARIYAARGVASAADLDTGFARLPHPSQMKGADAAARRLVAAIERGEPIVIVADYDADGATACAVALRGLRAMGARVDFVVPDRFRFGYGLTPEIVALAAERAPRVLVTVDNGIASVEGVAAAAARGIDVIVTDHHLPGAVLPSPAIIVDPHQPGCAFPSRNLAGVGVMWYVLAATRAALRERRGDRPALPNLATLLDLVALGTVADVVPLDTLNRTLVAQGLARIRKGHAHPGVAALFAVAGRETARASALDLGYFVGPRINAAGRLSDMTLGIRCLATDDAEEAQELAAQLSALNDERREIEAGMRDEAMRAIEALDAKALASAHSICLVDDAWHPGVVGIVASRLKDRLHRPTIVFAPGDAGEIKGSGRSIAGFHIRDALDRVAAREPGLVRRFGGHAMAAGVTLERARFADFAAAFEAVAREWLTPAALDRTLDTDGALGAGELTPALAHAIEDGVWGQGFPPPRFDGRFEVVEQRTVGGGAHLKLRLRDLDGGAGTLAAMAFGRTEPVPSRLRCVYQPRLDRFQGVEALTIILEHWEPDEA
jgi:single-stranded-DNA-specific exonuclease